MPNFHYSAMTADGRQVEGSCEAADEAGAMQVLRERRLAPLALRAVKAAGAGQTKRRSGSVGRREVAHFTGQLAALLNAGLPLARALKNLETQTPNPALQAMLGDIHERVSQGTTFAEALGRYPKLFSPLYISMVEAGELSGALEKALEQLAEMLEKDQALRAKLQGALTYPCIMVAVIMLSVSILMTVVLPKFAAILTDMGAALPLPTRVLMGLSQFCASWWWLILIALAAAASGIWRYVQSPTGRVRFDALKLRLPVFGQLVREVTLARFALTLGSLLRNGVPVLSALDAARNVVGNVIVANYVGGICGEMREGVSFSDALKARQAFFPPLISGMVGTGEQAGNLPEMLAKVGDYYAKEADARIRFMTTLIEPAIILIMGCVIGFVIMAILLPIFNIQSMIK